MKKSFSTDQDEPLFVHDNLAAMKHIDYKFLNVEENNPSPCIINLKSLSQLFGTWKIELTQEENSNTNNLGACSSHFNFDHSKLYLPHAKQFRDISL
ncbi:7942_t:CDS:2, partial [Gigaspora rosea]